MCHTLPCRATLWLIAITLSLSATPLHAVRLPQPTGDFIRWCTATYGQPLNDNPLAFSRSQPLQLHTDWVEEWASRAWLQPQAQPPHQPQQHQQPQAQPLGQLHTPGGLLRDFTLDQVTTTNTVGALQAVLMQLHGVLQPVLQSVAANAEEWDEDSAWQVFQGQFDWLRPSNRIHHCTCMPYHKPTVVGTKYIYPKHNKEYLLVWVGSDDAGKRILEHAHRLVCLASHGGPRLATADPGAPFDWRLQVNHKCNNPCCLNPKHLEWATHQQNLNYEGFDVGHIQARA